MAPLVLRAEYAIELGVLLEFLVACLAGGAGDLTDAVAGFGGPGYTVEDLRSDLACFALVVGCDDRLLSGNDS